jgi:uncharacterized protein YecT (DUF1311 family)
MQFRWLQVIAVASVVAVASTACAATATIHCRAAHGAVATTICGSPEYLAMDREIAALTDRAISQASSPPDRLNLFRGEAIYLHNRQGCEWAAHHSAHPGAAVDECVRASLEGRVRALRVMVDRGGL